MVDRDPKRTGRLGERIAERFLISRGYSILGRNFTTPFGEIDIIAEHDEWIVFLEVKTRISEKFGPPVSSITREKQDHIIRNCQYYLVRNGLNEAPCRIDVVTVKLDAFGKLRILRHLKSAIEM